jgi:hypothetical protein
VGQAEVEEREVVVCYGCSRVGVGVGGDAEGAEEERGDGGYAVCFRCGLVY